MKRYLQVDVFVFAVVFGHKRLPSAEPVDFQPPDAGALYVITDMLRHTSSSVKRQTVKGRHSS